MSPSETVVEKIKKLLALAEGNQNENERKVAMQFAMDLLAKHNLDIVKVQSASLDIRVEEIAANFRLEPWIRVVLHAACELYYTDFYISHDFDVFAMREIKFPVFVGTAENIAVTIEMAAWLIHSIRLESNRTFKDSFNRRSFRVGAADKIFARAREMKRAEEARARTADGGGGNLMVLRGQLERANEAYLEGLNLSSFTSRRTCLDRSAYDAGASYGQQVGLGTGSGSVKGRLTCAG